MNTTKRLLAVLMAAMLVFAMTITASADPATGSITITNATPGTSYAAYKVFDATYDSADNSKISYTYTAAQDTDAFLTALQDTDSPFELTATTTAGVYNVGAKAGSDAQTIAAWLKTNEALLGNAAKSVDGSDVDTDTVVLSPLDYGYYYITSTLGTVVTLDTNNPAVNVIDKNQPGPDIVEKVIDDPTDTDSVLHAVNYGDTVNFKIAGSTTNYDGDSRIEEVFINDTIGAGFDYDTDSFVLTLGGSTLVKDQDYTIVFSADGRSFKIAIDMYDEATQAFRYASPSDLLLTYDAVLNTDATIAGNGNKNTANFDYRTESDTDTTTDTDYHVSTDKETTTYTYALAILKVDENGTGLAGATFSVVDDQNNPVPVTEDANNPGTYLYDSASSSNLVTSPANGLITIKGVKDGTYTITETEAPAGYNKLTTSSTLTAALTSTSTYTSTITTYYDADGNVVSTEQIDGTTTTTTADVPVVATTVQNKTGAELPSTGGIGTTIFYVVGGVLVLAAAVLLITKKRMSSAK